MIRTYEELITLPTFEERYRYLKLNGVIGESTFGFDRWLNQKFYNSYEWKQIRNYVITRDNGCDLAIPDREILNRKILVHHMNPILMKDIVDRSEIILDPNYLITVSHETHNAIHYGDESLILFELIERKPNDTKLW